MGTTCKSKKLGTTGKTERLHNELFFTNSLRDQMSDGEQFFDIQTFPEEATFDLPHRLVPGLKVSWVSRQRHTHWSVTRALAGQITSGHTGLQTKQFCCCLFAVFSIVIISAVGLLLLPFFVVEGIFTVIITDAGSDQVSCCSSYNPHYFQRDLSYSRKDGTGIRRPSEMLTRI